MSAGTLTAMTPAKACSLLIGLLLALGCSAGQRRASAAREMPEGPVVLGRLVDVEGRGVADAQVLLAPGYGWSRVDQGDYLDCALQDGRRGRSEADGEFRIPAPPPGLLRVVVRKQGYAELDWQEGLTLVPDMDLDLGELALARAAVVRGRVVDDEGRGVSGAELYRTWAEGGMHWTALDLVLARSDVEGRFTIDVLPYGNIWGGALHEIGARAPGFFDRELDLRLPARGKPLRWREEDESDSWREGELEFTLSRGPSVRGHVRAPGGRSVPPWLLVTFGGIDVERITGFYGRAPIDWGLAREVSPFSHSILPISKLGEFATSALGRPGPARAEESAEPATRWVWLTPIERWQPWVVPAGPSVPADALATDEPIELQLPPPARAELRVVDAVTGGPIEELAVCVAPEFWRPRPLAGTRFPDGRVVLEGRAHALHAWIAALGYRHVERVDWQVVPGQTVDLGVLELEPCPAIQVRVTDALTGAPIAGARVGTSSAESSARFRDIARELPDFREAVTDADGRARLNRPGRGSARVWAEAVGYGLAWEPEEPTQFDELDQEIALLPVRQANVLVTDADGAPAAGLPVLVGNEVDPRRFTDCDGRVPEIDDPTELRVYVPGTWRDDREPWSAASWEAPTAAPAAGLDYEVSLRLPPLLPLEVFVLDSSRARPGLRWGMASWSRHDLTIDARGRLLGLEHALPGPLKLAVWWPDCEQPLAFEVEVAPGVRRYLVDLAKLDEE